MQMKEDEDESSIYWTVRMNENEDEWKLRMNEEDGWTQKQMKYEDEGERRWRWTKMKA